MPPIPPAGPSARPLLLAALLAALPHGVAAAQTARPEAAADSVLGRVTVTATRTATALEDVPVPTTVVPVEQARAAGDLRLADLLANVPGLALTADFGTGVQIQGLDPAYTLVLIDGEPVIGRTSGVLDLSRIALGGIERVEVVRGPSSSLYGSEALAGVVNLVTRTPAETRGRLRARAGSFATTSLEAEAEAGTTLAGRRVGARLLLDRTATAGYDLDPDTFGNTTPETGEWTGDLRLAADLAERTRLRLGLRATQGAQSLGYAFEDVSGAVSEIDQAERRLDWSVHPELRHAFGGRFALRASAYAAGYRLDTDVREVATGVQTYDDLFDQRLAKADVQLDALWNAAHRTVAGLGASRDALVGDRYGDVEPRARTAFAFAQHEWEPARALALNASVRFDATDAFGTRLSPKLAALVRPAERLRLRASVGTGFKAPDFRQLYLSFTNDVGGYLIFGAQRLEEGLARLAAEGRLGSVEPTFEQATGIGPETSRAVNAELEWEPARATRLTAGVFRNTVENLIDVQPVATLRPARPGGVGQPVFGYLNLDRVRTEGLTFDVTSERVLGAGRLTLGAGAQLLRSRDLDVLDALRAGTVFARTEAGRDIRLAPSDYTNLFNRSAVTGSLRAAYAAGPWEAGLRSRVRSRYGVRDLDGDRIAFRADEFARATAIWDATLGRRFDVGASALRLQLGVDNAFNSTQPDRVPSLAGRRVWAALNVSF